MIQWWMLSIHLKHIQVFMGIGRRNQEDKDLQGLIRRRRKLLSFWMKMRCLLVSARKPCFRMIHLELSNTLQKLITLLLVSFLKLALRLLLILWFPKGSYQSIPLVLLNLFQSFPNLLNQFYFHHLPNHPL